MWEVQTRIIKPSQGGKRSFMPAAHQPGRGEDCVSAGVKLATFAESPVCGMGWQPMSSFQPEPARSGPWTGWGPSGRWERL